MQIGPRKMRIAEVGLTALGVPLEPVLRHPLSAQTEDLAQAQRIIALSRIEHAPMVAQRFPADASRVEYWEVGDLPLASPAVAVEQMIQAVEAWIAAWVS